MACFRPDYSALGMQIGAAALYLRRETENQYYFISAAGICRNFCVFKVPETRKDAGITGSPKFG